LARSLHDTRPHWKLWADTPYSALFDANPLISPGQPGFVSGDVVDLDGSYEAFPEGHFVTHYAKALGVEDAPLRLPEIYLRPKEKEAALSRKDEIREASGHDGALVVMHAGPTTWPGKNIPPKTMDEVSNQLKSAGYNVAVVGTVGGHRPAAAHNFLGLGMRESAGVIGVADYFIGLDSFPATCAYAFRVPSVIAFGAVPPERVIVEPFFVEPVIDKWYRCIGCHAKQCHPRTWSGCLREPEERRHAPCMRSLDAGDILGALEVVSQRTQAMITEWLKNEDYWRPLVPAGDGLDLACGRRAIGGEAFDRFPFFHVNNTGDVKRELPYPNERFDWVFSSHSLEDLECPDWTMGEIHRVLKPGGKLIVSVPSDQHYTGFNEDHSRLFTMASLIDLLVRNGFTVTKRGTDIDTSHPHNIDNRYSLMAVGEKDA
jgi:SAM-dependent methyltransferase